MIYEPGFKVGEKVQNVVKNSSSAADRFSGILASDYRNAYIKKVRGKDAYEIRDESSRIIGVYHANDLVLA